MNGTWTTLDVGGRPAEIAHDIVRQLEEREYETDGLAPPAATTSPSKD